MTYIYLTVCAVLYFIFVIEPTVGEYIVIKIKHAYIETRTFWIWLRLYPRILWDTYWMKRRFEKIRKKYNKE